MIAHRHMAEFGTTSEQLAAVAVSAREWAIRNPKARAKEALTVEVVTSAERTAP